MSTAYISSHHHCLLALVLGNCCICSALPTSSPPPWVQKQAHKCGLSCNAGVEIYLRNPARYNIPQSHSQVSFSDVQEAAREHKETAVGYLLQDGTVLTAPHADHMQVLQPGDQIIAFADYA